MVETASLAKGVVSPVSSVTLALGVPAVLVLLLLGAVAPGGFQGYRSAAALVLVLPFLLLLLLLMADSLSPSARASGGPPAEASARGAGLGARPS